MNHDTSHNWTSKKEAGLTITQLQCSKLTNHSPSHDGDEAAHKGRHGGDYENDPYSIGATARSIETPHSWDGSLLLPSSHNDIVVCSLFITEYRSF